MSSENNLISLKGTVTDSAGSVLSGVQVTVTNLATKVDHRTQTGPEGRFFFQSLPAGSYRLIAWKVGFAPNIRRFLNDNRFPLKDAVRIEEMINYFTYDYPLPDKKDPFSVYTEISTCPWNRTHRLIHIGLHGKKLTSQELPPSSLVFLMDVSGSMRTPNKLPLLKQAFKLLVHELSVNDRVSIVTYAGAAGIVLPLTPAAQKDKIFEAVNRLHAGGSTAGGAGIRLAYKVAEENFIKAATTALSWRRTGTSMWVFPALPSWCISSKTNGTRESF